MANRIALDVIDREAFLPITITTVMEDDYDVMEDQSMSLGPNTVSLSTGFDVLTLLFTAHGDDEKEFDAAVRTQMDACYTLVNIFTSMAEHLETFVS